jgi:DNA-binding NarL/FixJ family response regulator
MTALSQLSSHHERPVLISPDMDRVLKLTHVLERQMIRGRIHPFFIRKKLEEILASAGADRDDGAELATVIELIDPRKAFCSRYGLTPKEESILSELAEGLSNSQIAKRLWIAEQTVKFHLTNIYRKLEVDNRTQAAKMWLDAAG